MLHNVRTLSLPLHLASLAVALLAALSGASPGLSSGSDRNGERARTGCVHTSVQALRNRNEAYAVTARRSLTARKTLNQRASIRFGKRNVNGVATTFGVLAIRVNRSCRATHYKVQLPIRPNGSTGWVRAVDVRLQTVRTRIVVDLSERRVTLFRDGRAILVTKAAIGAPSTPTPTGTFYVNQRLLAPNPLGGYGPGAVGISAFSPVLLNWPQGGPIAIHGTDAPGLIGTAVSHGCLRVHNRDAQRLLRLAVEGTPVEIRR